MALQPACLVLAVAALATAGCGARSDEPVAGDRDATSEQTGTRTVTGFGLGMTLPAGWDGRISRAGQHFATTLRAANFELPLAEEYPGPQTARWMAADSIVIDVSDGGPPGEYLQKDRWVEATTPISLRRTDFDGPYEGFAPPGYALRHLVVVGRALMVGAGFGVAHPSDELLAQANAVLETLTLDAEAARFAAEDLLRDCPRPLLRYPDAPGEWRAMPEATWLRVVLREARRPLVGETGSALITCVAGYDLDVWATPEGPPEPDMEARGEIGGVPVYARDGGPRALVHVQDRNVWLGAGPTSHTLPPLDALTELLQTMRRVPIDEIQTDSG